MINTDLIKKRINACGLTQEDCARQLGIATPTFNQKINNIRPLDLKQADELSALLKIGDDEFRSFFLT